MARQFLLLENTRAVIQAENRLKELNIPCRVMPVPRTISSECGMCLEIIPPVERSELAPLKHLYPPAKIAEF